MKAQDFFREVERGNLLPLYYFYGPEKWLVEEALHKIKEKALDLSTRDFDFEVFDASEHAAGTILASLQVFPVRSPRRVVVIRQADVVRKDPSPYLDYLQSPNPSACAVWIGEKVDLRTKFFQLLEKQGAIIPFYPLFEKDLIRWVHSQAENLGHPISEAAISTLLERIGPNLQELKVELQKLVLRMAGKEEIREEDVLALTEDVRRESPFELPWAVGSGDVPKAIRLLRKNLQQGDPPLLLLSLILRHLRLLKRAKGLRAEGVGKKEIEMRLRILPRTARDFWEQVERFPSSKLEQLWPSTLLADLKIKSARADKGLLLEEYVWGLFLPGPAAPQKSPTRQRPLSSPE